MLLKNNGSSPISVVLPAAPGSYIKQMTQIVCNADISGSLNMRYFMLNEVAPGLGIYVWFNIGGAGTDPGPFSGPFGNRTSVEVSVALNASASTIATALAAALNALTGRFTASATSADVSVTNAVGGIVPGGNTTSYMDTNTGFSFSLTALGSSSQQYSFAPGSMTQFSDSLAAEIQSICQQYASLEIILTGAVLNCSFIIDHANGNGLGVRTLKGPIGISQVYSHSSSPAVGNNCPAGIIQVFFNEQFSQYFGGFAGYVSPLSGSNVTAGSFTPGDVYVITSVGTTSWTAIGLQANIVPAPGVAFIATGAGAGTGTAQLTSVSGSNGVEIIGDPNTTINAPGGGYILMQCLTANVLTAPTDDTVVGCTFYLG